MSQPEWKKDRRPDPNSDSDSAEEFSKQRNLIDPGFHKIDDSGIDLTQHALRPASGFDDFVEEDDPPPVYQPAEENPYEEMVQSYQTPRESAESFSFRRMFFTAVLTATSAGVILGGSLKAVLDRGRTRMDEIEALASGAGEAIRIARKTSAAVEEVSLEKQQLHQEARQVLTSAVSEIASEKSPEETLKNLTPEVREAVLVCAVKELGNTTDTPAGSELLNWHYHREIVQLLDPVLSEKYAHASKRAVGAALQYYDKWTESEDPVSTLNEAVLSFQQVRAFVDSESLTRLKTRMQLYDRQVQARPELLDDYLKSVVNVSPGLLAQQTPDALTEIKVPGKEQNIQEFLLEKNGVVKEADSNNLEYTSALHRETYKIDGTLIKSSDGTNACEYIRFCNTTDPLKQMLFTPATLKYYVEVESLDKLVEDIEAWRICELANVEQLTAFELPEGAKTSYIRVFPDQHDDVIDSFITTGMTMAATLKKRYGDAVEIAPLTFSDDAAITLSRAVHSAHTGGTRNFVIDLYGHGSYNSIHIGKDLTPADVVKLVDAYPDSTFIVSTVACHGGGFMLPLYDAVNERPERKDRLIFMSQTKSEVVNLHISSKKEDGLINNWGSSLYYGNFQKKLLEGGTFGEAIRHADIETKKTISLDAGTLFMGNWITKGDAPGSSVSKV